MGVNSGAYNLVKVLHLLAVIIGVGAVFLDGIHAVRGKAEGRETVGAARYENTWHRAEWFIYLIPLLGIGLVFMSNKVWKFTQLWVSLSLLLYVVALGLVQAVQLPNLRRIKELTAEAAAAPAGSGPPQQVAELDDRQRRSAALSAAFNLIMVAIVALMVWKP
jgi:uncharacterized membrane protein